MSNAKKTKDSKKKDERIKKMAQLVYGRKIKPSDIRRYERRPRGYDCLFNKIGQVIKLHGPNDTFIRDSLSYDCLNIEEQFIYLRELTQLTIVDIKNRYRLVQKLLDCLHRHHGTLYQGLIFGSCINGLGFRNSDIDLRLRPLQSISKKRTEYEPIDYPRDQVENILKNIAYRTTRCSPAMGFFVNSRKCPVAKLTFLAGKPGHLSSYEEGVSCDVSLLSTNYLGSFNSVYIRFLCHLEPKFHLLATALRYWSKVHNLNLAGYLSSYALVQMLIVFCQNCQPPLLPNVDQMRDVYLKEKDNGSEDFNCLNSKDCLTRQEWNCLVCLKKECYEPSSNTEPLSLLLLKFFEFYLKFPYSNETVLTTRTGQAMNIKEFKESALFDEDYHMKPYFNIQDPFDLKHNLTAGIDGPFFKKFILKIRLSYERLCKQILLNFTRPEKISEHKVMFYGKLGELGEDSKIMMEECLSWGLNSIFEPKGD